MFGAGSKVYLKLKPDAGDRMKHIEGEIARAVLPYRENTEAFIVVCALVRVARLLLQRYPMKTRVLLRNEVLDFIEEKVDAGDANRIITIN